MCCAVLSRSVVFDSVTQWTAGRWDPLSMEILQARILEWVAMPLVPIWEKAKTLWDFYPCILQ